MTVEIDKQSWIERTVAVDMPMDKALAILRDPQRIAGLFPEFGIEVSPDDRKISAGATINLEKVSLEKDVSLSVEHLEIIIGKLARIVLKISKSSKAAGTLIESELRPSDEDPKKSDLEFAVYPPPEGGIIYRNPLGRFLVSRAINHELAKLPGRFKQVRNQSSE